MLQFLRVAIDFCQNMLHTVYIIFNEIFFFFLTKKKLKLFFIFLFLLSVKCNCQCRLYTALKHRRTHIHSCIHICMYACVLVSIFYVCTALLLEYFLLFYCLVLTVLISYMQKCITCTCTAQTYVFCFTTFVHMYVCI